MAKDVTNDLNYCLSLARTQEADLATIRHWNNLKIAFDGDLIWIKDLTLIQINSVTVKSIPFIKRYEVRGPKLFPFQGRLPEGNLPALLWSPMERGLSIELPKFNFNYFGTEEKIKIELIPSEKVKNASAMIVSMKELEEYILAAPEIRLQNIQWAIIDQTQAILFGQPLLPIPGKAFWQIEDFLIPAGYTFRHEGLIKKVNKKINPVSNNLITWEEDNQYFKINKIAIQALSISSFRMSILH